MSIKKHFIFVVLGFLLISCKKEKADPEEESEENYQSAIQLKTGNYWIYENKTTNNSDNSVTYEVDDSVFISKDTIVQGRLYYKMGNISGWRLVRDSAGCIIDHNGNVLFSGSNFKDTLYSHPGDGRGYMTEKDKTIAVPAGTFQTAAFMVITDGVGHHHTDNDPSMLGHFHRILRRNCYAKSVGMVKQQVFFNEIMFSLELKRYKLN